MFRLPPAPMPARRATRATFDVSCAGATGPGWGAGPSGSATGPGGRVTGLSTRRFLSGLQAAQSVAGLDGGAGSPSSRGGFDPGTAPADFERVAALVELAQKGDAEAFGMLYERYVDTVYRYIYVRVGRKQTAEDLTSETFVRALRRIDSFSWQGRDIAAWFVTIARNLVTDHTKSARFRLEVTTADMLDADKHVDAPDDEVLQRMRDTRLIEAVRSLQPDQAECLVLRFLEGLTLTECAKVLNRSEGAVKQLQLRAVRSLRRELDHEVL